jgi:hypothetical protein
LSIPTDIPSLRIAEAFRSRPTQDFIRPSTLRFVAALAQGCIKDNLPSGAAIWTLKPLNGKMVHFPGLESNKLYVRACYPILYERKDLINELKKEGRSSNNVVIGIPGIGKSSFGIYAFCRLFESGRPVVYCYDNAFGAGSALAAAGGRIVDKTTLLDTTEEHHLAIIVDGTKPTFSFSYATLLLATHRSCTYEQFSNHAESRYMPPWSLNELLELRALCFDTEDPDLSIELVLERVRKWGIVPRHTLVNISQSHQDALEASIDRFGLPLLKVLLSAWEVPMAATADCYVLVQLVVDGNAFSPRAYDFASEYVCENILRRITTQNAVDLFELMEESFRLPAKMGDTLVFWMNKVLALIALRQIAKFTYAQDESWRT